MTVARDHAQPPDSRSVALGTGATGTIDQAIDRRIAARPGYEVVLLCRNPANAQAAVAQIQRHTGNPRVRYELADLSRHHSIAALAARWRGPVHVLVNNAAVAPRRRAQGADARSWAASPPADTLMPTAHSIALPK
jgi:NAD(P)-dependent dehydrogenase (short-subunit alcohol dehydrogenase family)